MGYVDLWDGPNLTGACIRLTAPALPTDPPVVVDGWRSRGAPFTAQSAEFHLAAGEAIQIGLSGPTVPKPGERPTLIFVGHLTHNQFHNPVAGTPFDFNWWRETVVWTAGW